MCQIPYRPLTSNKDEHAKAQSRHLYTEVSRSFQVDVLFYRNAERYCRMVLKELHNQVRNHLFAVTSALEEKKDL